MNRTVFACSLIGLPALGAAQSLPVTADAVFTFNGQEITISRSVTPDPQAFDIVSRAYSDCVAPCLSPMTISPDVATLGELEVIDFLSTKVEAGQGLLIDARMPEAHGAGHIPASVNIPTATIAPENPYRNEILIALGAQSYQNILSFNDVLSLVVFDDGPATQDAPQLITDLLEAGYPADKIAYYRGGMQVWSTLGLSTQRASQ